MREPSITRASAQSPASAGTCLRAAPGPTAMRAPGPGRSANRYGHGARGPTRPGPHRHATPGHRAGSALTQVGPKSASCPDSTGSSVVPVTSGPSWSRLPQAHLAEMSALAPRILCAGPSVTNRRSDLQFSLSPILERRSNWDRFVSRCQQAPGELAEGQPEPFKAIWSHSDDVVIIGTFGGYERGWQEASARLDWGRQDHQGHGSSCGERRDGRRR